jgi:hypothetical protein
MKRIPTMIPIVTELKPKWMRWNIELESSIREATMDWRVAKEVIVAPIRPNF